MSTLVGTVATVVLAACTDPSPPAAAPWESTPYSELIDTALEEARAGQASDQQIALLEQARAEGEVSLDLDRTAARNVVECLAQVGGDSVYVEESGADGLVVPNYTVGFDEDLGLERIDALVSACNEGEFYWVSTVYQLQPSSKETIGRFVMSQEDVLRRCLEDGGVSTDAGANGWELAQVAVEVMVSTDGKLDCLDAAGIGRL